MLLFFNSNNVVISILGWNYEIVGVTKINTRELGASTKNGISIFFGGESMGLGNNIGGGRWRGGEARTNYSQPSQLNSLNYSQLIQSDWENKIK